MIKSDKILHRIKYDKVEQILSKNILYNLCSKFLNTTDNNIYNFYYICTHNKLLNQNYYTNYSSLLYIGRTLHDALFLQIQLFSNGSFYNKIISLIILENYKFKNDEYFADSLIFITNKHSKVRLNKKIHLRHIMLDKNTALEKSFSIPFKESI